jgi:hypothetical protein
MGYAELEFGHISDHQSTIFSTHPSIQKKNTKWQFGRPIQNKDANFFVKIKGLVNRLG